jgi:hypothetical protein
MQNNTNTLRDSAQWQNTEMRGLLNDHSNRTNHVHRDMIDYINGSKFELHKQGDYNANMAVRDAAQAARDAFATKGDILMKMQDIAAINTRDVLGGTASLMNQASLNTAAIQLEAQKNKYDLSKEIDKSTQWIGDNLKTDARWVGELDRSRIRDDYVWGHHHSHHGEHYGHHGHHDDHHRGREQHIHNNLYNRQRQSRSRSRSNSRGRRGGRGGNESS